jgi:hypothetical protein
MMAINPRVRSFSTLSEAQKKATVVVGGDISHFDDDIETKCDDCDSVIYLRPHTVRMAIKMPKKICTTCCVIAVGLKNQQGEKVEAFVTPETVEDFRDKEEHGRY